MFIKDGGRDIMASVKPERDDGSRIPWRDIANAAPGSTLHNQMVDMANDVRRHGDTMIFTFHHEPEQVNNQVHGNSDDFKAAFRKMHDVFEQQGATNARFTWVMTSWAFQVGDFNPNDRRVADKWYPGDDVVDYISVQEYNWFDCRDSEPWQSFEEGLEPVSYTHLTLPTIYSV